MVQIVALLCVFGLGMCFSLLGSVSVKLMPRTKIDTARFGTLISALMISCLVASVVIGLLIDKYGHQPFAAAGFVITAGSIFIIARAKTYDSVLAACLLLGVGAMCLNDVGNTLLPRVLFGGENVPAALNLGNVFFGLGLFLTPLITSLLLRKTSYENAVTVLAVIVLVPVIFTVWAGNYPEIAVGFEASAALKLLVNPVVIVAALALFCYISLEASFSNWIPPYSKEIISRDFSSLAEGVVDATSQQMLSIFAVAMMVGRLVASQVQLISAHGDVVVMLMAALAGVIIAAMTKSRAIWTSVLVACAGLTFATCFPTVVAMAFEKHPENSGSVFGIIFAVGLLGAVIIPKAIGNLAKGSSVQSSLRLLVPACVALMVLAFILGRL
jgi:fucose permease